jgi:hypothetical protein
MATAKRGVLTAAPEWWVHLRWRARDFWKSERRATKAEAYAEAQRWRVVWSQSSGDGQKRVDIVESPDGMLGYAEFQRVSVEDDGIVGPYEYFDETQGSGRYVQLADALRDARAEIAWLGNAEPED